MELAFMRIFRFRSIVAFLALSSSIIYLRGLFHDEDIRVIIQSYQNLLLVNQKSSVIAKLKNNSTRNCLVQFKDDSTLLCISNNETSHDSITLLRHLLQHHFEDCSADFIRIKDLSRYPELRFQRRCLFILEENITLIRPGDIFWGYEEPNIPRNDIQTFFVPREIHLSSWNETNTSIETRKLPPAIFKTLVESFPVHFFHPIIHENKTAVILLGDLRGGELTWNTLYKHVLDINNADLILVPIGEIPEVKKSSSLLMRAKFTFHIPHFDDWADVMDIISRGNRRYRSILPNIIGNASILLGGSSIGRAEGSGALIFSARWILREYIRENRFDMIYDRFVLTRSDQYYICDHNLSTLLPMSKIFIPQGEDYRGICDRHLVCSSSDVNAVLNVLPPLIRNPDSYRTQSKENLVNTETFLKLRLEEIGLAKRVERFSRMMFIAGIDGDTFTWNAPVKKNLTEGVYFKYPQEYIDAKSECYTKFKEFGSQNDLQFKNPPIGNASFDGNRVTGWACDEDNPLESVNIKLRFSPFENSSDFFELNLQADKGSGPLTRKRCNGGNKHSFSLVVPVEAKKYHDSQLLVIAYDLIDSNIKSVILNTSISMD